MTPAMLFTVLPLKCPEGVSVDLFFIERGSFFLAALLLKTLHS
jgi:hypothetical protein